MGVLIALAVFGAITVVVGVPMYFIMMACDTSDIGYHDCRWGGDE
jgi:hypothetical protein